MTEKKRFVNDGECVMQNNQVWCVCRGEHSADVVATALNELINENEQLKQEIRNLRDFRGFITEKNVENEQQRKELQLQMLRLYNYFEDYFEDGMGSTAFSEMWDNVKESEKWDKKRG